jgi:hypothetical protein
MYRILEVYLYLSYIITKLRRESYKTPEDDAQVKGFVRVAVPIEMLKEITLLFKLTVLCTPGRFIC